MENNKIFLNLILKSLLSKNQLFIISVYIINLKKYKNES